MDHQFIIGFFVGLAVYAIMAAAVALDRRRVARRKAYRKAPHKPGPWKAYMHPPTAQCVREAEADWDSRVRVKGWPPPPPGRAIPRAAAEVDQ